MFDRSTDITSRSVKTNATTLINSVVTNFSQLVTSSKPNG